MASSISSTSATTALVSKSNDYSLSTYNRFFKRSFLKISRKNQLSLLIHAKLNCYDSERISINKNLSFNPSIDIKNKFNHAVPNVTTSILALGISSVVLFSPFASMAETLVNNACAEELGGADVNTLIVIACIAEGIALTGAFVGGLLARQRKGEVEKINAQLRQINFNLRRQARLESYAPGLSYVPVTPSLSLNQTISPSQTRTSASTKPTASEPVLHVDAKAEPLSGFSAEVVGKASILRNLKLGKKYLRERNPLAAFKEFKLALSMAKEMGDTVELKKAARGCGASFQRQGKHLEAIKYHSMVLEASESAKETSGNTEAYGAIADCYTEIGDLENAAKYYDLYITGMEKD